MNENILKLPSVAILIDCWDMSTEVLYENIIDFIDNTPEITIIILASYDTDDLGTAYNNVWYETARKTLPRSNKTSKKILDYVNKDKLQIATTSFDDLMGILNKKHPEIKNIYFMGHSWNKCIHDRPIGIFRFIGLQRNVIINQTCVWNEYTETTLNVEKDQVHEKYVKLKDNIYQIFGEH